MICVNCGVSEGHGDCPRCNRMIAQQNRRKRESESPWTLCSTCYGHGWLPPIGVTFKEWNACSGSVGGRHCPECNPRPNAESEVSE